MEKLVVFQFEVDDGHVAGATAKGKVAIVLVEEEHRGEGVARLYGNHWAVFPCRWERGTGIIFVEVKKNNWFGGRRLHSSQRMGKPSTRRRGRGKSGQKPERFVGWGKTLREDR